MANPLTPTSNTGVEYIRGVEGSIAKLSDQVSGLQEVTNRLRADIALESKLRGGDISTLQHKLSSELASEISRLQQETEGRFSEVEGQMKKWCGALGQEIVALKPRIDLLNNAVAERKEANDATNERIVPLEKAVPALRADMGAMDEKFEAKVAEIVAQASADRETAASAVRIASSKATADFKRAEERLDALLYEVEANKKAHAADCANISSKLDGVEAFAYTRAKAADVQALELRINETIDKNLRAVNEELTRKEYSTTVKAVSDRLTTLALDVNANDAKAKMGDEVLQKHITTLEQALAKTARQLDQDRERSNECWISLEKEVATKAVKLDLDATIVRIGVAEQTLMPLAPAIATKADATETKQLQSRVLTLEQQYPTKADAAELPKLHLMIADYAAKHSGVVARAQEQHNRLERFDDVSREIGTRLYGLEERNKEVQVQIGTKAEIESVYNKESSTMMFADYYRREEIDAMMTRVWWRVGDTAKSPRIPATYVPGR